MIIYSMVTTGLSVPILQITAKWESLRMAYGALTPIERWDAARRLGTNFTGERWFVIGALVSLLILTVLFLIVSRNRKTRIRRNSNSRFFEYAGKSGLSEHESGILLSVARVAGLKQTETIFTMGNAFDIGAAKLIELSLVNQGVQESEQLKSELSYLREKLGFVKKAVVSGGTTTRTRRLSSRQIPVGKQILITRRRNRNTPDIEATVITNNDLELTIQLSGPLSSVAGDLWRARYFFGASVWEFDTSVVSCDGDMMVLNHSDNVRFINRRRFLRVSVNKSAYIARFPFSLKFSENPTVSQDEDGSEVAEPEEEVGEIWGPPAFVPSVVTELAGPGLRIETSLDVKVGERLLVIFRLDEEDEQNLDSVAKGGNLSKAEIVEDIGEVRHIKAIPNGFSIAVELTGLNDSDVNVLIRATNAASVRSEHKDKDASKRTEDESTAVGSVAAAGEQNV